MTNTATANRILDGHSMDFTARLQFAMRADGQWFSRGQYRGHYGYTWSPWKASSKPSTYTSDSGRTARLPKGSSGGEVTEW